ncbi:MAG: adenylate/guanylate cyclase domain-containing protein [Desulfobacterales bacterium]|jgi:class 3 adenylate cyclase
MNSHSDHDKLRHFLQRADQIQTKLDRSIFHLRTLYEVSKEIYSSIDSERIIQNFLLMTMGNYGVIQAFIALVHLRDRRIVKYVQRGLDDEFSAVINSQCLSWCDDIDTGGGVDFKDMVQARDDLPIELGGLFPFAVRENQVGFLGMGSKISGEGYGKGDIELIETLLCNLTSALNNAGAFEEIKLLNAELKQKNTALEDALGELRTSFRKIEMLESIKDSLAKFVPHTVTRLIEKSPEDQVFRNKRQDIAVLFLDIENYTQICNRIGSKEASDVIEAHFSVFMDAIYANRGDINETVGDGLMVLYLDKDPRQNVMNAVRTALTIRDETLKIVDNCPALYKPLHINIGINSGQALVGAAKFDSLAGSRWTYTARGQVVNIAARISAFASSGDIYLTKIAAQRVQSDFAVQHIGSHELKNVPDTIDIFKLLDRKAAPLQSD